MHTLWVVPLDAESARRAYDRIGRVQDTQRFYEDPATKRLTRHANLGEARSVFELGCGTGRYAAELLATTLPADARYLGVDVSPKMVRLARDRLAQWTSQAEVRLAEPPGLELPGTDGAFDRFLATYVFDLLSTEDAQALIGEAYRLLQPHGLLALAGLTHGTTALSRAVSTAWSAVESGWPGLVGGCRPVELTELVDAPRWRVAHREVVTPWGVASEVLVASRRDGS